jgi:hypothetical protein
MWHGTFDEKRGCPMCKQAEQAEVTERLREEKILRQSQVYHAMTLVDRILRRSTCDETFMADVDEAKRYVNQHLRLVPLEAAEAAGGKDEN